MQTVTSADGTEIAYERHGDGRPLVLLHGGGSSDYWQPLVPHLADDYELVLPDRRGYGESEAADDYSLEREVEDVRAVLELVDDEPVLFGHSFGGLQAVETARVADAAAAVAYEPAIIVGEYAEGADLADRMEARIDDGDREGATKLYIREVLHGGEIGEEAFEAWLAEWEGWPGCVDRVERTLAMNRQVEQYDLPDAIDVETPTLVLSGTEGPSHLRDSARALHAALPHSRFVDFDGVSHVGPLEAPERVLGEIEGFLRHALGDDATERPPAARQ
jgi:pimeloyl-ACP methyl ester carboxylesterase